MDFGTNSTTTAAATTATRTRYLGTHSSEDHPRLALPKTAETLSACIHALEKAEISMDFRRLMPADELARLEEERRDNGSPMPESCTPCDPDIDAGFTSGDGPAPITSSMLHEVPEPVLRASGDRRGRGATSAVATAARFLRHAGKSKYHSLAFLGTAKRIQFRRLTASEENHHMAKCSGKFKSFSGGCSMDLYKCGKCGNVGCTNVGNGGCSNLGWKGNVCTKCGTNQGNAMPDGKPCKRPA